MSAPLSEAEAAPLKLLLGAKSKGIVDKIVSEVFKQLHAPLDKRALIEQSLEQALSLAAADAASLHTALRQFVSVALRVANASGGAIDASLVLPSGFHGALSALLCDVVSSHAAEWRDSAIVRQPSLPRLVDMDWRVDVKTASDSAAQMSVPTVLMRLTLAGDQQAGGSNEPVTFELTRDALKTLLESMTKIRSQLQSITAQH